MVPRSPLRFRLLRGGVCALAVPALSSCGASRVNSGSSSATTTVPGTPLPTDCLPKCGGPTNTANTIGVLAGSASVDHGCLRLTALRDPAERVPVVWPYGSRAEFKPTPRLLNAHGQVIAVAGDTIQFGGAGAGPVNPAGRCMLGQANAAVAGSPVVVVTKHHR